MPDNLPYPLQFDPTQWANKFSLFGGKALPWPPLYSGNPTDALGNPIQPPPQGTTLTSVPTLQPAAPASSQLVGWGGLMNKYQDAMKQANVDPNTGKAADQDAWNNAQYYLQQYQAMRPQEIAGPAGSGRGYETVGHTLQRNSMWMPPQQSSAPTSAPQPPANTMGLDRALGLLSNPGNPVTPGIPVQNVSANTDAGGSGLAAFLKSWGSGNPNAKIAAPGIGGGSSGISIGTNSAFLQALNALRPTG